MPIREYTLSRVIFKILSEPGRLRIRVTTTADMVAFGVERHQMPSTKVVAVVPLACVARALPKIGIVATSTGSSGFVVSRNGKSNVTVGTPALGVHRLEVSERTTGVLVVPERQNCVGLNGPQQLARVLHVAVIGSRELLIVPLLARWTSNVSRRTDHY